MKFLTDLEMQRFDDHRLYHHSRVNQLFHLYSALSFITSYFLVFINPVLAAFVGWHGMIPRQIGHFFFEPRTFDSVNNMSHEQKEEVKIGYNLERKRALLGLLAAIPACVGLYYFWGFITIEQMIDYIGYGLLFLGIGAVIGRSLYLIFTRNHDRMIGVVWFSKIMTDPFNDIRLYWRSPFQVMKRDWYDPGIETYPMGRYWMDKIRKREHDESLVFTTS